MAENKLAEPSTASSSGRALRKMFFWITIVFGLLIITVVISTALQVDNWQRDLSTNFAETSADALDQRLRPISSELSVAELIAVTNDVVPELKHWDSNKTQPDTNEEEGVLRFVRTTALFRFQDDITVYVVSTPTGSLLTAESRSRVGRGDLGQNPRNLIELLEAIRRKLPNQSAPAAKR